MFLTLFKSIVGPHLEYGSNVWSVIYKKEAMQIDLPENEYMVKDLELYSGTKPKPSCYDFSPDLLYPRIVSEKIRLISTPEVTVGAFDLSSTSSILKKELLKIDKIQFAQYQRS
jgi:hypothetical protein